MLCEFNYKISKRFDGKIKKSPIIDIPVMSHSGWQNLVALLDSGSENSIVPYYIASILGLKLGKKAFSHGVTGITDGHFSKIKVCIDEKVVEIDVIVIDAGNIPIILGRNGIFNHFDIKFMQNSSKILLESAS